MKHNDEIILYQPDSSISLEVRVEDDTVWLTQKQMTELFLSTKQNISLHINNIFKEGELDKNSVVKESLTTANDGKVYSTKHYNLDVIISVGYRVKSIRGTQFRQWANTVLKEYLLRGYSINQKFIELENRIDNRFYNQQREIDDLHQKIDLVINSSLKPKEGIFFRGEIFDAYEWLNLRIEEAQKRIVVIDPYADYSVLSQLKRREDNVLATVYTSPGNSLIDLDIKKLNKQYPGVLLKKSYTGHDRFLIIDDLIYHVGGSMKDLGNRLMAYSVLTVLSADELIRHIDHQ